MSKSEETIVHKASNRTLKGFEESTNNEWKEPFTFIQAADTQLGMISNFDKETGHVINGYPDKITWDREVEICRLSVELANSLKPTPKFFVICGDILDAFPDKFPEVREKQRKDFLEVYAGLKMPLVCVCGNHDVGDIPTPATIDSYRNNFGDDYFSFWIDGVHCLALNSQFYENRSMTKELAQEQDTWLDDQLASSKDRGSRHIIVFQHIPIFVKEPTEEKIYFNYPLKLRMEILDKFYSAGVKTIFCGHYHRNAGGFYKEMELVVTSAVGCQIGDDPHGFRLVSVSKDKITHQYLKITDNID